MADGTPAPVKTWDLLVRASHWTVAGLVLWNLYEDSGGYAHRIVGYGAAAVVMVRIAWGFVGTAPARFTAWFPTPRKVLAYLSAVKSGHPPRHVSHNPLGGSMALVLWLLVLALAVTGWMSGLDAFWGDEWLHRLHSYLANALLVCAAIHVLAAIAMSFVHRENLIGAMITGIKRGEDA